MLKLPDLTNTYCLDFQACGQLGKGPFPKGEELIARPKGGGAPYVRLFHGSDGARTHLHLEVTRPDFFEVMYAKRPTPNATLRDIRRIVKRYYGEKSKPTRDPERDLLLRPERAFDVVVVLALYRIPVGAIHSSLIFTGPNAVNSKVGNVSVEVGGARLLFEGSQFVRELEWAAVNGEVLVSLEGHDHDTIIDDDYALELFEKAEAAIRKFVTGTPPNAPA